MLNELINQKFLKEYEKIKRLYPETIQRIETQGSWLGIILQRSLEFLKKLALDGEFEQQLNPTEKQVYEMILKIREIEA